MIVYKTTNLINGKIYIGRDKKNNPLYLGSGTLLIQSIKKYGKENFKKEILEICKSVKELNKKEQFWIKHYNSQDKKIGYNITKGGDGNSLKWNGDNLKSEHKAKISYSLKKSEKFKKMWEGDEHKKKLREARKKSKKVQDLIKSIEWKNKISNSLKNSEKYQESIKNPERSKKISDSLKNSEKFKKTMSSEEFKKKCSVWQKGKKRSPEYLKNFHNSRNKTFEKRNIEKKDRLLKILNNNNFNILETSKTLNVTTTTIYRLIKKFKLKNEKK